MSPPEWLVRHDSSLRLGPDRRTWFVCFDGRPHYKLIPSPAAGRFTCQVMQTENGQRLDKSATYATADDAVHGGLEELRVYLGW
jgi:hypothetical protein